jgi:hypothetical protein
VNEFLKTPYVNSIALSPDFSPGLGDAGMVGDSQAAEILVQAVILSSSEGSGFEFSSDYRLFVACWLLRMTVLGRFSAACKAPPFQSRGEKSGLGKHGRTRRTTSAARI